MSNVREEILGKISVALRGERAKGGLGEPALSRATVVPASARFVPRQPGDQESEIAQLLAEIEKLAGVTRRLRSQADLKTALADLVQGEGIKKATLWTTSELQTWGVATILAGLGVEIVPAQASEQQLAGCDLGVTGADAALPETGTLVLRSTPEQPPLVSLLPRVHLVILTPAALRADLHPVFAEVKPARHLVFITGPSRTTDIEKTLAIGVHGPKSLYVWMMAD